MTASRSSAGESLLQAKGRHSQRQRQVGASRVVMTLSHARRARAKRGTRSSSQEAQGEER